MLHDYLRLSGLSESSDDGEQAHITDALKEGYKLDGLDGLKMAAYNLEKEGVSKKMLSSILRKIVRENVIDGTRVHSPSKFGFALLAMYADDLHKGAI
jgi:hypothetical protein